MSATTWNLWFDRITDDEPNGYDVVVLAPPPDTDASTELAAVPEDLRRWAQSCGGANGAQHVTYAVAVLADVTGYAAAGACAVSPVLSTIADEPIR
jgi:hypothetical protein